MLRENPEQNADSKRVAPVSVTPPDFSPCDSAGYSMDALHVLAARLSANPRINRQQFHEWVGDTLDRQPELRALEWVPCISHENRLVFEQNVRQEGFANFHLTELDARGSFMRAGAREEYFPVYYVEPMAENQAVFGFDLGSNVRRRSALEKARATSHPVATAPIHLAQEGDQFGFLVVLPVYDKTGEELLTPGWSRLRGFAVAVFHIGSLVDASSRNLRDNGIEISIYDGSAEETLIYSTRSPANEHVLSLPSATVKKAVEWTAPLDVGGHPWLVKFHIQAETAGKFHNWSSWAGIASGLFSTGMLAASHYNGLRHAELIATNTALREELLAHKQVEAAAQAAYKAKTDFLAAISHEIRTPLNAILGYVQILQQDLTLQPRQRNAVEAVAASGAHLLNLLNDVLDFSKIDARPSELRLGEFSLNLLLHDLKLMFHPQCERKRLRLQLSQIEESRAMVCGDEGKLRQVLINLLSNAVKFTTAGAVRLVVQFEPEDHVRFEVIDTGVGITEAEQKEIFHPFSQGAAGRAEGGAGLGLAIARQQVECMGGELTCLSAVGSGSRFFFAVPLPPAQARTIDPSCENPRTTPGLEAGLPVSEVARFSLPRDLYVRLRDAAELHNITVLKRLLQELRQCGPEGQQLAAHAHGLLSRYDLDAVSRLIAKMEANDGPIRHASGEC